MYSKQELFEVVGKVTLAIMIIIAGFLSIAFLITLIVPPVSAQSSQSNNSNSQTSTDIFSGYMVESPNVTTSYFANGINGVGHFANRVTNSVSNGANQLTNSVSRASKASIKFAVTSVKITASGIRFGFIFLGKSIVFAGKGLAFIGKTFTNTIFSIIRIPGAILSKVTNATLASSVVRPSDYQTAELIDPNSSELLTALTALPPTSPQTNNSKPNSLSATSNNGSGPVWPITGRITTQFGVAHWPYQPTHTGLDISDGKKSGVTPIRPFRNGKVIETIKSNKGYGNHVIIDHGNGVTSLYAHLYSIEATVGQEVTINSVIGYEGSTGMSTGTHLHFEVRVNNKVADPHKFVAGEPF